MTSASAARDFQAYSHEDLNSALLSLRRAKFLPEFRLILQEADSAANTPKDIFVIIAAEALSKYSELIKEANQSRKLRGLFVHLDTPAIALPQLFAIADLRLTKNVLAISRTDIELPRRVMQAWAWDAHHDLIGTAQISGRDKLLVTNCALETFVIQFADFKAFRNMTGDDRQAFDIETDGTFIHWPKHDVHLGMDDIRYVCDEAYRKKVDAQKLAHDEKFGAAITRLRKSNGYTQANVPGVSERTMRDIENGSRPSISTLQKLAASHGVSLNQYLEAIAQEIKTLTIST